MRPKRYLPLILSSSSYRSLMIILSDLLASISPEVTQERIGISFSSFLRYCRRAKRYCLACLFDRSEEHTSELQSRGHLVCRLLLEKKKKKDTTYQQIKHH